MYQWREIIDSGNGITDKQIDAVVSEIKKKGAPPEVTEDIETLKQVIRLCTFRDNFVNFEPVPQGVNKGSLKKKRTQRKKTQRKKTQRKKTQRKKTQRKKTQRKKTKKSVKTGGSGLSDDNVVNIIIGVFVVLLFAHTPVLLAALEAFVIAFLVNLVVFLINGFRSICCGGEEEESQMSRGSHEIQETSSERQRRINRIIKEERKHTPPLMPHLIEKCRRLIRKHEDYEKVRRAEAAAAQRNPSFMLVQTDSAKREQELGLLY
jgi:F0F1-type ATP synthase assembly protein I